MQNKSALWIFTILLALACLYSLSFSFFTSNFEDKARNEAMYPADSVFQSMGVSRETADAAFVDSVDGRYTEKYLRENGGEKIYPLLGMSYNECKDKELNLGLDLKGGMAVTLEVSIPELVANLAGNPEDEEFNTALAEAKKAQLNSGANFVDLFLAEYNKVSNKPAGLASLFASPDRPQFDREGKNEDIASVLKDEVETAVDNTQRIIRARIDKFGVTQPTIQKEIGGRILVELPGVKDKERVRALLQSTANLEFYECYKNQDINAALGQLNADLSDKLYPGFREKFIADRDTTKNSDVADSLNDSIVKDSVSAADAVDALLGDEDVTDATKDSTEQDLLGSAEDEVTLEDSRKLNPLFSMFQQNVFQTETGYGLARGAVVGYANVADTADLNKVLFSNTEKGIYTDIVSKVMPSDSRMLWGAKEGEGGFLALYVVRIPRDGKAELDGKVVTSASQDYGVSGAPEVVMQMNPEGAQIWRRMTTDNVGNEIAVVLDNLVYSAPTVNGPIPNGRSSISMGAGTFQEQIADGQDLANILKAGALPAPARIIDETVVGPTLGQENIDSGLMSFIVALILVLIYMVLYYARAGFLADIALVANLVFLIGALASMQAALTLPGIAGIVLTIGMAVDANVLIFDRIREEMRAGKMVKSAVEFGYSIKGALSAILDANITTGITAVILLLFGSGPIKGFATTLIIGIFTSLFAAIFITRLLIYSRLEKKKDMTFWTEPTKNILANPKFNFIGKRKMYYGISFIVIAIGIVSMFTKGFTTGVDFDGGYNFVTRFDETVDADKVRGVLDAVFLDETGKAASTQVKTYGSANQLKIATNYLVENTTKEATALVEAKLEAGLETLGVPFSIQQSRKVDATISDDIKVNAMWAVGLALLFIFIYIAIRFKKWQFGLGAILALLHDVLIVLGLYSILDGVVSFALEINGDFIAAILTVVGYSINDTVVVFDRIREFLGERKRESQQEVVNDAMNATLSRTVNTSLTTFLVLLVIFIAGGVSLKGFVFALLVGVVVGTYSSLFIATNSVVDLVKDMDKSQK